MKQGGGLPDLRRCQVGKRLSEEMIQPLFNGMLALMLAKFMLNDVPHAADLLVNPTSIPILYDITKDKGEVTSASGFLEYILSYIKELSTKYNVKGFNKVYFIRMDKLAVHVWGELHLNPMLADAWKEDRELAEKLIRHLIAHEFRHWLTQGGHIKIPLPKGPKYKEMRKEYEEKAAKEFAEQESGITEEEIKTWMYG